MPIQTNPNNSRTKIGNRNSAHKPNEHDDNFQEMIILKQGVVFIRIQEFQGN